MRKLGIILAVMIAATLGYSGTASAQQAEPIRPVCDAFQSAADGAPDGDPVNGTGEPFTSTFQGAADSCNESIDNDTVMPTQLLCGITDGLTNAGVPDPPAGVPAAVNDGAVDQPLVDDGTLPTDFYPCDDGDDGCTENCGNGPGDDDDDDAEVGAVQRSNATADGGLPRTGGELFAGAGFGLMSLGALVRRFLP